MHFEIDSATLSDLEINGKYSDSIFQIFNKTRTIGGRRKLEEWITQPHSILAVPEGRTESIAFFIRSGFELKIKSSQLDMIDHYLSYHKRLQTHPIDVLVDVIYSKFHISQSYYTITSGISNLIDLIRFTTAFSIEIEENNCGYLSDRLKSLKPLLDNQLLKKVVADKRISLFRYNSLDKLFRKTLLAEIKDLLDFIYEADVLESAAEVVRLKGWVLPEYNHRDRSLSFTNLFHPLLSSPVKNDFHIDPKTRVILLTGPNMAGKSSFLKSVGLSVYLAHLGFPVPADSMETPLFEGLITTINLPDDVKNGLSHFYSEVMRIKKMALKIRDGKKLFVIMDEIFKGTNPKDAYDASFSLIQLLSQIENCVFMISTHTSELAVQFENVQEIDLKSFPCKFEGTTPVFTYKLATSISNDRIGMNIINEEKVFDILSEHIRQQ